MYVGVLRVQPGRALYDATGSKPQAHCVSYALKYAIQERHIIIIKNVSDRTVPFFVLGRHHN